MSKLQESIDALKSQYPDVDYRPLEINLSSQKSVRAAAAELMSWSDVPTVNFVINSAGIMLLPKRIISEDGIELTLATNHIGHFLFTCLIMPKLIKAAEDNKGPTRIVNVTSGSPRAVAIRWSDHNFEKTSKDLPEAERPPYALHKMWGSKDPENMSYIPLEAYNQSKVANVLFSIGANQKLFEKYGIVSLAVHPGVIKTELGRNAETSALEAIDSMVKNGAFTYKSLGAGSSTTLVAALDPKLGPGEQSHDKQNYGTWLMDCQITTLACPLAESNAEAEKLWQVSEKLVGEKFSW